MRDRQFWKRYHSAGMVGIVIFVCLVNWGIDEVCLSWLLTVVSFSVFTMILVLTHSINALGYLAKTAQGAELPVLGPSGLSLFGERARESQLVQHSTKGGEGPAERTVAKLQDHGRGWSE